MLRRKAGFPALLLALGMTVLSCRQPQGMIIVDNTEPKHGDGYVEFEHLHDIDITLINLFGRRTAFNSAAKICFDRAGDMYILDEYTCRIHVFDTDGRLAREFGQEGQGPGDFLMPFAVLIRDDRLHVFQGLGGECKILDLTGHFLSSRTVVIQNMLKIMPAGGGFFVMSGEVDQKFTDLEFVFSVLDETLSNRKELSRRRYGPGLGGPNYDFIWQNWLLVLEDGGFCFPEENFNEFSIIKHDGEGRPRLKMTRPYRVKPYSEQARTAFHSTYEQLIQAGQMSMPDSPPVVVNMFADERRNLWVVSGETGEDSANPEFENAVDIFDRGGRWLSSFRSKIVSKSTLCRNGRIYRILSPVTEPFDKQIIEVHKIKYLE